MSTPYKQILWFLLISVFSAVEVSAADRPPNIVLILVDDLGWSDTGVYESTYYRTPNIDSLARAGVRFTDAYAAAPVCSPSRAAIMTGKYPARLHITDWLPGRTDRPNQKLAAPKIKQALPLEEVTIAEALKARGYVSAHVGKWHLGGEGFGPLEQGFNLNIAGDHTGTPLSYFAPFEKDGRTMPGLKDADEGEYLTDRLTEEALHFIEDHKDKPFFLHFSHYTVHIPLKAKQEWIDQNLARTPAGAQTNAIYAAMIDSLDESVGRVIDKLDQLDLSKNTVVIFTSDNGGLTVREGPNTPATSNTPLRNGKGYLQEGGIREPLIVRWPGIIEGEQVSSTPVIGVDLYPTILEIAGVESVSNVDGVSLYSLLTDGDPVKRDALYWHYPHHSNQAHMRGAPSGGGPGAAIRFGDWKLIQHFETGRHELYDLRKDIGEDNDLAESMPDRVIELAKKLHAWQRSVKAQYPKQNPGWKPSPIKPDQDGNILLHSRDAFVHGKNLLYEPQPYKNTIGYWTILEDYAHWDFSVNVAGEYRVEILQGCGKGSGGSEVEFAVGEAKLVTTVLDTGHFQNFVNRELGTMTLGEGKHRLTVKPLTKPGVAVMDLREVHLIKIN